MTANEKAARLIGWTPNRHCNDTTWTPKWDGARCDECGYFVRGRIDVSNWLHDIPAPEMSRPENLWKLLEAIWRDGRFMDFDPDTETLCLSAGDIVCGPSKDPGALLLEAALLMYDAEHPEVQ